MTFQSELPQQETISCTQIPTISIQTAWWATIKPEQAKLTGRSYDIAKRALDITLVTFSLPLLLPLLFVIALCIKLDSPRGSIIFKQQRTGHHGHRFAMYKFRTMVHNAESLKKDLQHLNELTWPDFKITNDPRITRVGRFLRRSSLDELPQLINVLLGNMSLVGPRPTSFAADTYEPHHLQRLDVKPGLTGLWQIIGRASMEFDDRVALDIAYIERRSLSFDVKILFFTVFAVWQQKGAC
ncbi:MAG: sugar transferase [Anaerolineales bacterium]|nr:sugar transferase [Anaerolineales bacterium]